MQKRHSECVYSIPFNSWMTKVVKCKCIAVELKLMRAKLGNLIFPTYLCSFMLCKLVTDKTNFTKLYAWSTKVSNDLNSLYFYLVANSRLCMDPEPLSFNLFFVFIHAILIYLKWNRWIHKSWLAFFRELKQHGLICSNHLSTSMICT